MRRAGHLLALLSVLAAAGCGDPRLERVARDADAYVSGVQYRDALKLIKHQAAFREKISDLPPERREAARDEQMAAVEARLAEFDVDRESGALPLSADGIDLIQGLAIGKGIFYNVEEVTPQDGDRVSAVMRVLPDYAAHRFDGLPPGTRVYLLGEPFGQVESVVLGESPEERTLRLVTEVRLEWRLRWFPAEDVYPEGWAVESIRALPESVRWSEIRRVF